MMSPKGLDPNIRPLSVQQTYDSQISVPKNNYIFKSKSFLYNYFSSDEINVAILQFLNKIEVLLKYLTLNCSANISFSDFSS